jgi:hypothetical protein
VSILRQRLYKIFRRHIPDEVLLLLIGKELSLSEVAEIQQHLTICPRCSAHFDKFQYATQQVDIYARHWAKPYMDRPAGGRDLLQAKLNALSHQSEQPIKDLDRKSRFPRFGFSGMEPSFAYAMFFAIILGGCVFAFMDLNRPQISSGTLLVQAEAWDSVRGKDASAGVIRQRVRIKSGKQALEREIYRDAQGLRRAKLRKLNLEEEQLKEKLAIAGVAWDTPLSAATYQDWYDRQTIRKDQVRKSDKNLLVLTTTTPNGTVAAQSLIVRDYDFHPVARTIVFRDKAEIEIAELDYRVLPWEKVSMDLFESTNMQRANSIRHVQSDAVPSVPVVLSDSQMDDVELGVRLVLNQLNADTGEQLQIVRTPSGVIVQGLVETDQRRKDLVERLHLVPHVKASIVSIAEALKQNPDNASGASEAQTVSVSTQPSPLETYFVAHGRDSGTLHNVSQQLLHEALTASQESRAISDLLERFARRGRMTELGNATLVELVYTHREKLLRALYEERALLRTIMPARVTEDIADVQDGQLSSLISVAERNLTLCEELALGSNKQPRNAETIISELVTAVSELRAAAHQAQVGVTTDEAESRTR